MIQALFFLVVSLTFLAATTCAAVRTKQTFWLALALLWACILGLEIAGLIVAIVEHH